MKIEGPGRVQPRGPVKSRGKTATHGGPSFADSVADSGDTGTAAVTGSNRLSSLDALLPLQEISDQPDDKRRALQRGEELLDRLDDIRMGLLMGGIPRDRLKQLLNLVEQRRNAFRDPRLADLLDDIELRAKVELAKRNLSTTLRHRRFLFTDSFLLLWEWRVG